MPDAPGGRPAPAARQYAGWVKDRRGTWRAVVGGPDLAGCHGCLLHHVRQLPAVRPATAVLPVGVHPAELGGRKGKG
jgi:hypothetical protein